MTSGKNDKNLRFNNSFLLNLVERIAGSCEDEWIFLTVQWSFLRRIFFYKNIYFSHHCRTLKKKSVTFCLNFFYRVVKTTFRMPWRTFWGNITFLRKLHFFIFIGHSAKSFQLFSRVFSKSWQNCSFYVSSGTFWSKLFFRKIRIFTIIFGQLTKKFRLFVGFLFCRVVKATFYVSRGTLWRKIFFEEITFFHLFRPSAIIF